MEETLEPWLATLVDEALAPYRGVLPAAELAWMRSMLAERIVSDPDVGDLVRAGRPRLDIDTSGRIPREAWPDGMPQTTSSGDGQASPKTGDDAAVQVRKAGERG